MVRGVWSRNSQRSRARTGRRVRRGRGDEEELAGRLAAGEGVVGGLGVGERVAAADVDLQRPVGHGAEDLRRTPLELVAGRDVVAHRRPGEEQRAAAVEALDVERRDLTARATEEHHRPATPQRGQRRVERRLPDPVVDDVDALAAGQLLDLAGQLAQVGQLGVVDDVVGAQLQAEGDLLRRPRGPDERRALGLDQLDEQLTDPAGHRVDQDEVARLDRIRRVDEVVSRDPLEHHGPGDLEVDPVGDPDRLGGVHQDRPRRAARPVGPGHPVTDGQVDAVADRLDGAGALAPDDERRRDRVDALALVDVDEVDPGRRHGDAHLARARRRDVAVLHGEDVGAAVPGDDESGDGEGGGGHGGQPRRVDLNITTRRDVHNAR